MTDVTSLTTTPLAGPTAAAVMTTAAATALSTWGSYALVLIVLGLMLWRNFQDRAALKEETAALRTEIRDLERLRLEDAKQLIRVTESSTALTTTRAQGDENFQAAVCGLATRLAELIETLEGPEAPSARRARPRGVQPGRSR